MFASDAPARLPSAAAQWRVEVRDGLGVILHGPSDAPTAYLDAVFADPVEREAFFGWVDAVGLIVARNLAIDPAPYRPVRGKHTTGRMSQGEYFHHDGCSTPIKPRVVEIRCPGQARARSMGTSVVRYPDVVGVMLDLLPAAYRAEHGLAAVYAARDDDPDTLPDWDVIQGRVNRVLRQLDADDARAFLQDVDRAAGAYREPWTLHESRFIANDGAHTLQHRRACPSPRVRGTPNGRLLKRWPAEQTMGEDPDACAPCARGVLAACDV